MSKDKLLTNDEIAETEQHYLIEAPISELADFKGISLDEAVELRIKAVRKNAMPEFKVTARTVDSPSLKGFASICVGESFVVEGFKIINGKNGLFVGMPSTVSKGSYYDVFKPITKEFRQCLIDAILAAYQDRVEKGENQAKGTPLDED